MLSQKTLPAVSVIVPIYNVEKYLEECVDSILGQTFRNIEIILVDDGSTDSSRQMADDYAAQDERIRVIHKENGGASSARNAGMKIARGEYIYFCDSDDYISLNAIEILYDTAIRNDLDMVLFNGDVFLDKRDVDNDVLMKRAVTGKNYLNRICNYGRRCKPGKKILVEMYINDEYRSSVCLQFIQRTYFFLKHLDFYEGIIHEDHLFTLKALLLADKVMFLPRKIFYRRIRAESTTTNQEGFKNFYGYFIIYCEAIIFLSNHQFEKNIMKEVEKLINRTYKGNAVRIWHKLSNDEKIKFRVQLSMLQKILFDEMLASTQLSRKIRNMLQCFHRYGLIYTCKQILKYFGV